MKNSQNLPDFLEDLSHTEEQASVPSFLACALGFTRPAFQSSALALRSLSKMMCRSLVEFLLISPLINLNFIPTQWSFSDRDLLNPDDLKVKWPFLSLQPCMTGVFVRLTTSQNAHRAV